MKILIVDDESKALKRLVRLTRAILGEVDTVIETATSISSALRHIEKCQIDLLLLDLNLNGKDGFEVLKTVLAESFHTIVVSAYHDRALEAFEYGVLDFVPKPVKEDRLKGAVDRFYGNRDCSEISVKYLPVKIAGKVELIAVKDILYFSGANGCTEIHTMEGKVKLYDKTLDAVELLHASGFERIHRSYIVRSDEIKAIHSAQGTRYCVELKNGSELPVGRTRIEQLRRKFFG